jgi:hypothetical protein
MKLHLPYRQLGTRLAKLGESSDNEDNDSSYQTMAQAM